MLNSAGHEESRKSILELRRPRPNSNTSDHCGIFKHRPMCGIHIKTNLKHDIEEYATNFSVFTNRL